MGECTQQVRRQVGQERAVRKPEERRRTKRTLKPTGAGGVKEDRQIDGKIGPKPNSKAEHWAIREKRGNVEWSKIYTEVDVGGDAHQIGKEDGKRDIYRLH